MAKLAGAISIQFWLLLEHINSKYLFSVSSRLHAGQTGDRAVVFHVTKRADQQRVIKDNDGG